MKKGFTLVELSIVLVIIGLLIGGTLVAQSMIQTAKIHRTISELTQYKIAIQNFYLNYKTIPGDSTYFSPPGDGNGFIDYTDNGCVGTIKNAENFQVWGHIHQAGMMKGTDVFSPGGGTGCGGTHQEWYNDPANGGVVWPFIELDSKATTAIGGQNKVPVNLWAESGTANGMPFFNFAISAWQVIPLETKIGTTNQMGVPDLLYNILWLSGFGDRDCLNVDGSGSGVATCSDPIAAYTTFYYFMDVKG